MLALALREKGHAVTLVTPGGRAGQASGLTAEMWQSNAALIHAGVEIVTNSSLAAVEADHVTLSCVFSGNTRTAAADWVVPVTRREPNETLFRELQGSPEKLDGATLACIGDCHAPGIIASAVHSGYKAAIEFDNPSAPALIDRDL